MEPNEIQNVPMTAEERAEYEAFKAAKEKKAAEQKRKEDRKTYADLVDAEVERSIPVLQALSGNIKDVKQTILDNFKTALEMKSDVLGLTKDTQKSHTFTTSDNKKRIIIGRHCCDGWKDTVNDGVAIVKEACLSLIKDETTKALVNQIMRLLSRDSAGNLKASKALQLRKLASDLNNDRLTEGITIIEEAYIPSMSRTYIYAGLYNEQNGVWERVPLGMTEA